MSADRWAPGGMYDTDTVTARDRFQCFTQGHDVRSWGTICGWCRRCKHSVHTYDRKSVLYHGEFHRRSTKGVTRRLSRYNFGHSGGHRLPEFLRRTHAVAIWTPCASRC